MNDLGSLDWLVYVGVVASIFLRVVSNHWKAPPRSLKSRLARSEAERFEEEMRIYRRVPLALQERLARKLGYSKEPVDWSLEPVDWRRYPLSEGALEGIYHPEHVATSMRELAAARSQDAAEAAIRRVEYAVVDPDHFIHFPAALPVSRRLLDVVVDGEASPWARWAAAAVLTTLLAEPDPALQLGGSTDDTSERTYQAIVTEVKGRAASLRQVALAAEGPRKDRPQIAPIVRHVLCLAGESI